MRRISMVWLSMFLFAFPACFSAYESTKNEGSRKLNAPFRYSLNGMTCALWKKDTVLQIELSSQTSGWMLIGFNRSNQLEGADFKMFRKVKSTWESSDRFNTGGRNYPGDETLGGKHNIQILKDLSTEDFSTVKFEIPLHGSEKFDFNFLENPEFTLILAWSVSPDWEHHSRERKHFSVSLDSLKS